MQLVLIDCKNLIFRHYTGSNRTGCAFRCDGDMISAEEVEYFRTNPTAVMQEIDSANSSDEAA